MHRITLTLILVAFTLHAYAQEPAESNAASDAGEFHAETFMSELRENIKSANPDSVSTADPDGKDFKLASDENTKTMIVKIRKEQARLASKKNDPKRQNGRNPHWAIAANVADAFTFGTMGIGLQYTVSRNVTLEAKARYNPWTWNDRENRQFHYRHQTYTVGARWWPWYTFSGWWVSGALQYQQYNRAGIGVEYAREGDAYGATVGAGYSVQIFPWMNIDLGAGFFAGYHKYNKYACPVCGKLLETADKPFILPDFLTINLMFVF